MTELGLPQYAHALNALGHDLHPGVVDAAGNAVVSPVSIGTALAMALAGARQVTRVEMEKVLHLAQVDAGARERAATALATRLARWAPGQDGGGDRGTVRLALATALMLTRLGKVVDDSYRTRLRDGFATEIFEDVDLDPINAWTKRHTDGMIPTILDRLDPLDVCVLLAAIHLKADWLHPFDPDATIDAPFALSSGDTVSVPTMRRTGRYATLARPGYRAIRLPYADPDLGMILVLPDAASGVARLSSGPDALARLTDVRVRLEAATLAGLIAALAATEPGQTELALPRFTLATSAGLAGELSALGMPSAFSDDADLSGMSGERLLEPPLYVRKVVHKAVIEVAEAGTRAAAVTAVVVAGRAAAPPPRTFFVDRPFLFFVSDGASGAVLFRGQVGDPRGAA